MSEGGGEGGNEKKEVDTGITRPVEHSTRPDGHLGTHGSHTVKKGLRFSRPQPGCH
jgi:hypothetical protein